MISDVGLDQGRHRERRATEKIRAQREAAEAKHQANLEQMRAAWNGELDIAPCATEQPTDDEELDGVAEEIKSRLASLRYAVEHSQHRDYAIESGTNPAEGAANRWPAHAARTPGWTSSAFARLAERTGSAATRSRTARASGSAGCRAAVSSILVVAGADRT